MSKGKYLFPVLVIVPLLAWYVLFMYYPAAYSIWASLHLWVADNPAKSTWVGLKNYIDMFTIDPRFQKSLANTFIYVLTKTALVIPIGLVIALLFEKLRRGPRHTSSPSSFRPSARPRRSGSCSPTCSSPASACSTRS